MPAPVIERALLEKLERLTIRWQKSFRGLVGGHNPSRYSGPGQEFLDHRHFHEGDDLRAVNWRAYMRLEKLFLKMFEVEPRTPIRLLIDASGSMTAGVTPGAVSKFDYARRMAAALVYVGLVRHDTIVVQPYHDRLDDTMTASGGRHRFGPVADFLGQLQPKGAARMMEVARLFINAYPKPGLAIIISDFMDEGEVLQPLQYIADFGHEPLLMQLWTPFDRDPGADGDFRLREAESGGELELSMNAEARRAYVAAFDHHAAAIEDLAWRNGGRYAGFQTDLPLEDAVYRALDWAGASLARRGA